MNIRAEATIHIGGQDRKLKMGTNATALFCQMHSIPLSKFSERFAELQLIDIRDLTYCALLSGNGGDVDFSAFEVGEWMDEPGAIEQIMKFFESIESPKSNETETTKKKR
jgi:hypothetical protein